MGSTPSVFIAHPETGKLYDLRSAAKIIGISYPALVGRVNKGWVGEKLWSPGKVTKPKLEDVRPERLPKRSKAEQEANLNKIPKPTKLDKEMEKVRELKIGGIRQNAQGNYVG